MGVDDGRGHTEDRSGELDAEQLEECRGVQGRVYEAGVVERGASHCCGEEESWPWQAEEQVL